MDCWQWLVKTYLKGSYCDIYILEIKLIFRNKADFLIGGGARTPAKAGNLIT